MTTEHRKIEELAHRLWEARGAGHGGHEQDWQEAEAQIRREKNAGQARDESSRESFPASDAPSSHLPDVPPSNAPQKWADAKSADPTTPSKV